MLHLLVKYIRADVLEDNNGNELSDDQQEYFKITSQGIGTVFGLLFLYQLFAILEKGETKERNFLDKNFKEKVMFEFYLSGFQKIATF